MNTLTIGATVKRLAPEKDYTKGRIGKVIEMAMKDESPVRVRVAWEKEADGRPLKIRTWVKASQVEVQP